MIGYLHSAGVPLCPLSERLLGSLVVLGAGLLLGACASSSAEPQEARNGNVSGAAPLPTAEHLLLVNPSIEVGVSAPLGRITRFGPRGGENLIWLADSVNEVEPVGVEQEGYVNRGGDKVWTTLQAMWSRTHGVENWPPDPSLDGPAWTLERLGERRCRLTSPVSPHTQLQVVRLIELHDTEPLVTITNTLQRPEYSPFPVMIWSVSQTVMPRYALLGVSQPRPQGTVGGPYHALWKYGEDDNVSANVSPLLGGKAVRWDLTHEGGGKIGTLGSWCAAVFDTHAWVQQTAFNPSGSYPDASNIQTYTHGEYLELETLSPQVHLAPGERFTNRVIWRLLEVDGEDAEALAARIEALPDVE